MEKYILSLDLGTTSVRAILFRRDGSVFAIGQKEFTQYFPMPGMVEHDGEEIWEKLSDIIKELLEKHDITADMIDSIGITNQRETAIVWDNTTGKSLYHAICWQDKRTANRIDKLVDEGMSDTVKEKTGLTPDAYFSATKLEWLLDKIEDGRLKAESGKLSFGTIDSWIIYKLTGGKVHATDRTNASRTMLYNIHSLEWDDELLAYFNIPKNILPKVYPSSYLYGYTDCEFFDTPVVIAGVAGDQQSALYGQCCFDAGSIKNTYGTGGFLLLNTGNTPIESTNGLLTTIAASAGDVKYALEGSVFVCGACIQWLRDELGIIKDAAETENLAKSIPDTGGVYFVPAFVGLGAPYWDANAGGLLYGLSRGTTRAHIARSALEAMAYQTADVIRAMETDLGNSIKELKVDGGAAANEFLLQFQSDILSCDIVKPACLESTALGAAFLAGLASGYYKSEKEIAQIWKEASRFMPSMEDNRRTTLLDGWQDAVKRSIG